MKSKINAFNRRQRQNFELPHVFYSKLLAKQILLKNFGLKDQNGNHVLMKYTGYDNFIGLDTEFKAQNAATAFEDRMP